MSNEAFATTLATSVDPTSLEFIARAKDMKLLEDQLVNNLKIVYEGGGERARQKVREQGQGKLLVRERYGSSLLLTAEGHGRI